MVCDEQNNSRYSKAAQYHSCFLGYSATKEEKVMIQMTVLEIDAISGFVTCDYDSRWWLAFVLGVDTDNSEVKLTFLHPSGPSLSFRYTSSPHLTFLQL